MTADNLRQRIKVVVVDDHPRMRGGIIALLQADEYKKQFEVVGEAESGYHTLMLCQEKKPDILILDLKLAGDMSGFEVMHEIRQQHLPIKILVMTATLYARNAAAREMGAERYLLKDVPDETIIETLQEMANQDLAVDYGVKSDSSKTSRTDLLTSREVELLRLAAQGLTQAEIGDKLAIEKGTVGVYFNKIYDKIHVKNIPEAVAFAFRNKLIS